MNALEWTSNQTPISNIDIGPIDSNNVTTRATELGAVTVTASVSTTIEKDGNNGATGRITRNYIV
jgi:hypothetical protein